jgi:2-haloacid dehalogenase
MPTLPELRDHVTLLTFDCYGTLIDWEAGMRSALQPLAAGAKSSLDEIIRDYIRIEASVEQQGYRRYREVQAATLRELGKLHRFRVSDGQAYVLAESLPTWAPFPDTVEALARLRTRYRLGVLSNIDRDLFAASRQLLQTEFDLVITAEDVQAYKPAAPHFLHLLRSGLARREHVLHVAQSLFHDGRPAQELGLHFAWIDRYGQKDPQGVRMAAALPNLASFAEELGV